jgi:hypothetical protein
MNILTVYQTIRNVWKSYWVEKILHGRQVFRQEIQQLQGSQMYAQAPQTNKIVDIFTNRERESKYTIQANRKQTKMK